ncbi:MAG: hypothetical protein K9K38_09085 [Rhodoferax sp.]|nr:hypothetical protein [Rhodoferax sp.]MCF8209541.1 hypothetical protein [Rhodoferax sp.]
MENINQTNSTTPIVNATSAYIESISPANQQIVEEDLRTQLLRILATDGILPNENEKAILGWELIGKIRSMLKPGYSDNSVKNYLSQLSKNENSPIAKTARGFGYFRRSSFDDSVGVSTETSEIVDAGFETGVAKRDEQSEERFRALYIAYMEREKKFPANIEHTKSLRSEKGINTWKFSDVISLDWNVGVLTQIEDKMVLDNNLLEIRKAIGHSPFNIISSELKVGISLANYRQFFFQCLSNSNWANEAHLVLAHRIEDSKLVECLKQLGASFGVSIYSFNIDLGKFDKIPSADKIRDLKGVEREKLVDKYCSDVTVIYQAQKKGELDWEHIQDVRVINSDFNAVFKWIPKCLTDKTPYSLKAFKEKEAEEYKIKYIYDSNSYRH